MITVPSRFTRYDTLVPRTALFRSRVLGGAVPGVDAGAPDGELVQGGLADDHRSGRSKPGQARGVDLGRRGSGGHRGVGARGRGAGHVDQVLDGHPGAGGAGGSVEAQDPRAHASTIGTRRAADARSGYSRSDLGFREGPRALSHPLRTLITWSSPSSSPCSGPPPCSPSPTSSAPVPPRPAPPPPTSGSWSRSSSRPPCSSARPQSWRVGDRKSTRLNSSH